jgi:hypothetical protein
MHQSMRLRWPTLLRTIPAMHNRQQQLSTMHRNRKFIPAMHRSMRALGTRQRNRDQDQDSGVQHFRGDRLRCFSADDSGVQF